MKISNHPSITRLVAAIAAALTICHAARADIPVSGRPVPEMTAFDDLMTDFMDERGIEAGLLGIMKDGEIVYLRGFGWLIAPVNITFPPIDIPGVEMTENALVRLASVTKPVTAAATHRVLADYDEFDLDSLAFSFEDGDGGVLPVNPTGGDPADERVRDITIRHLMHHRGGWDRSQDDVPDWTYRECHIAADLDVDSPPGREVTLNWILGEQPLQFNLGGGPAYSNIGYLALGLLVEHLSGQNLVTYVRQNVLTPSMHVPWRDIRRGRTFRDDAFVREPFYRHGSGSSAFECGSSVSNAAYGAWDHEARVGQGGMIATSAAMLTLAKHYHIGRGHFSYGANTGKPRDEVPLGWQNQIHGGVLRGSNTILYQRTDDINVFVFFNERDYVVIPATNPGDDDTEIIYAEWMRGEVHDLINAGGFDWPETTSDGLWVRPESTDSGGTFFRGGYHYPINGIDDLLGYAGWGSKVRLAPRGGNRDFDWTGEISSRMVIDAPEGTVFIGR